MSSHKIYKTCANLSCFVIFHYFSNKRKNCCSDECKNALVQQSRKTVHCHNPICYHMFFKANKKKYCSHSCSAQRTNLIRTRESRAKQTATIRKTFQARPKKDPTKQTPTKRLSKIKSEYIRKNHLRKAYQENMKLGYEYTKIKRNMCSHCSKQFYATRAYKYCSEHQHLHSTYFQEIYKFNFKVSDFPDLFDLDLIMKYGWYRTQGNHSKSSKFTSNLTGVSRDHKVSIKESIKNGYDPYYISHVMNCQLMLQSTNSSKHHRSSITYDELKILVDNYDAERVRFELTGSITPPTVFRTVAINQTLPPLAQTR